MKIDWIRLHVGIGFTISIIIAIFYAAGFLHDAATIPEIFFYFIIIWLMMKELFRSIDDIVSSFNVEGKRK